MFNRECDYEVKEVKETLPTYKIPSTEEFKNYVDNYETAVNDRLWWYK